jgi:shikimate kinase
LERELLAELLSKTDLILAAGGGAILDSETREKMRNAGLVVWLRASAETLIERIQSDPTTTSRRPNLTSTGGPAEIQTLLAQREPLYRECAHRILDFDSQSPQELAETVAAWAESWQAEGPTA